MTEATSSGRLTVIGLGPGGAHQMTPEARLAVEQATDFFGYFPYVERLALGPHQRRHASDNREEMDRSRAALTMAMQGRKVAVVSGGDAGVFAMAAAVLEAIDHGPAEWRDLDIAIIPGVTAMLAVAACVGAPLGHDFCAMSLSDNLKPWGLIETRLRAVASVGLVIALYNPVSKARAWQLGRAFEILREILPAQTPVVFGRAAGRPDEKMAVVPLAEAHSDMADMATCIIIGSPETRVIARDGRAPLVYAPRSVRALSDQPISADRSEFAQNKESSSAGAGS